MAALGGKSNVRGEAGRDISVKVGETWVGFTLDHPNAKPDHHGQWHTREGKADTLRLSVKGNNEWAWTDQPKRKLEQCLSDIVAALAVAAEHGVRATAAHRRLYSLKRREEMREEIEKRRAEADAAQQQRILDEQMQQRGRLLRLARQAQMAGDLRAFIQRVEESSVAPQSDTENWSRWANQGADELDPLTSLSTHHGDDGLIKSLA